MELNITGTIFYTDELVDRINNATDDITLVINSPGGNAFGALDVVNAIKNCKHKVTARIEVMACSAAAMIALACDHITMEPHGILMIHKSWALAVGNSNDLESKAGALKAIDNAMNAAIETHCTDKTVIDRMETGDVWMSGDEAREYFDNIEIVKTGGAGNVAAAVDVGAMILEAARGPASKDEVTDPTDPGETTPPAVEKRPVYDAVTLSLI
nr:MAG TPA: Putative ATP dependent Clp protease [Bacteriophage sp.]